MCEKKRQTGGFLALAAAGLLLFLALSCFAVAGGDLVGIGGNDGFVSVEKAARFQARYAPSWFFGLIEKAVVASLFIGPLGFLTSATYIVFRLIRRWTAK